MNRICILSHKIFKIELENPQDLEELKAYLSFKLAGVEYSPAFKAGWNGMTCLVNSKNQILLGLLPRVKRWLAERQLSYEENTLISPSEKLAPRDLSARLKQLKLQPRPYQQDIVDAMERSQKGIIRACTGAGKTLAAAMMIAKLNRPANLLVISLDLLEQFHQFFSEVFQEPIGYIGNGICKIERINVISIWSLARAFDVKDVIADEEVSSNEKELAESDREKILKCLETTKVFLLDECHVASTNTIKAIHKAIDPEFIYGLSGTPFREDNSDLLIEGFLSEVLIDIPASQLISQGYLVQPLIKFVPVPSKKLSGTYQEIYQQYIVEHDFRNNLILQETLELVKKGYKVLVLFRQIKHGEILEEKFSEAGLKFGYLSGRDKLSEREIVKKQFTDGKINVILASTIFDIGLNLPSASGLVLAGGGKSRLTATQRIGRILRTAPGKPYAAVIDFYDQVKYLKKHSQRRHEIYSAEPGFRVSKLKK